MKIFLGQINPTVGAIEQNLDQILRCIALAKEALADVAVFPELALSGAPLNDLLVHRDIVAACEEALRRIAGASTGLAVVMGSPATDGRSVFDGAILFHNGEEIGRQHDVAWRWEVGGKRLGVIIGEGPFEDFAEQADMIIHLAASPWSPGIEESRRASIAHRALIFHLPYLFVNLVGGSDGWIFDGNSFFTDAEGVVLFQAPDFQEYIGLVREGKLQDVCHPMEAIRKALVLGIKDFFWKQGYTDAVIGLSGGLDSSVTAALAVQALGEAHVHGLLLPSKYTSSESIEEAKKLCHCLGITYRTVSIDSVVGVATVALEAGGTVISGLTAENLQSRVRALFLMAECNASKAFLLGTGNKSELACGYATLYGDLCGALLPLGDLFKTEVYELARHLNAQREVIPDQIIQRAPTAELKPEQKDADDLPEYHLLDPVLRLLILEGVSPEDVSAQTGMSLPIIRGLCDRLMHYEFKRRQGPCVLRVSQKAFGTDIVYPIVNRWYR